MADRPRVSVVMPFYDAGATLARALDSVGRQSVGDWEIVLVDDASPVPAEDSLPGTEVARLRVVRHDANKGAAAARNTGIAASRGEWVAFLDADDAWHPQKLERQLGALDAAGGVASVTGFNLFRGGAARPERYQPGTLDPLMESLADGCTVSPGSTLMVRRHVFDEIGLFDESLRRLEDWDWLLRLAGRYGLLPVPEILADVHVSHATGSVYLPAVLAATREIRTRHLGAMAAGGWARRRHFLSTLVIEDAAAYHRAGRGARAAWLTLRACLIWPMQFRRLVHRLRYRFGT